MGTISEEKKALFDLCKRRLGAPVRSVELTDEQFCAALDQAMQMYNEYVLDFVVRNNWSNLYGKQLSNLDIAFALSVRTLDISKDFSDYYSKLVGLQQVGTKWELKKDFFQIEDGKQSYVIPAGRAINKVLFITPPVADASLMSTYYGGAYGFGGMLAQVPGGSGGAFGGMYGMGGIWNPVYGLPMADVFTVGTQMQNINKFLANDLMYKVTAGPEGTHIIHLMSTPGGKAEKMGGFGRFRDCYCWYTYYDVNSDNLDECMRDNPDLLLSPDQVPLNGTRYELLNDLAKSTVTQLFISFSMETLAFIRGKFSGDINFINSPVKMDYNMFLNASSKMREDALKALKDRLDAMSPYNMLKLERENAENINAVKKTMPRKIYVR